MSPHTKPHNLASDATHSRNRWTNGVEGWTTRPFSTSRHFCTSAPKPIPAFEKPPKLNYPNGKFFEEYGELTNPDSSLSIGEFILVRHG